MMEIVANASPLIFLAKIEQLASLKDYRVVVPPQVVMEIRAGKDKTDVTVILCFLKSENVSIEKTEVIKTLPENLGMGERAAISLAVRRKITHILLDERKARKVARLYGLEPKGTLWVVKDAQSKGKLSRDEVKELAFELVRSGFRIREELLIDFLRSI